MAAGDIGIGYTLDTGQSPDVILRNVILSAASATITLSNLATTYQRIVILGVQDAAGGRTLSINDGTDTIKVPISLEPNARWKLFIDYDGTDLRIFVPTGAASPNRPEIYARDYSSLNAAVNAVPAGGGKVILDGAYILTESLTPPQNNIVIEGQGATLTKIIKGADIPLIDVRGVTASMAFNDVRKNIYLNNLTLDGAGNTAWMGPLLRAYYAQFIHCTNVNFLSNYGPALSTAQLWDSYLTNCRFDYCGKATGSDSAVCHIKSVDQGVAAGQFGSSGGNNTNNLWFKDCVWEQNRDLDLWFDGRNSSGAVDFGMDMVNKCRLNNCKMEDASGAFRRGFMRLEGVSDYGSFLHDMTTVGGNGSAHDWVTIIGTQVATFRHTYLNGNDSGGIASSILAGVRFAGTAAGNADIDLDGLFGVMGAVNAPNQALVAFEGINNRISRRNVRYNFNPSGPPVYSGAPTTVPEDPQAIHKEGGDNARQGAINLVAGTATVNTTAVTANSRIFLTYQNISGGGPSVVWVNSRVVGSSFTIFSGQGTDTSLIAWSISEPSL